MALELKQQLRLTQQLVMTPQLQQAIKLLQLNLLELVGLVQQELEENPVLEEIAEVDEDEAASPTEDADGTGTHSQIYVGETEDLKERMADHHKQSCFESNGYNAISIHRESNHYSRAAVEKDLIDSLNPPCNG